MSNTVLTVVLLVVLVLVILAVAAIMRMRSRRGGAEAAAQTQASSPPAEPELLAGRPDAQPGGSVPAGADPAAETTTLPAVSGPDPAGGRHSLNADAAQQEAPGRGAAAAGVVAGVAGLAGAGALVARGGPAPAEPALDADHADVGPDSGAAGAVPQAAPLFEPAGPVPDVDDGFDAAPDTGRHSTGRPAEPGPTDGLPDVEQGRHEAAMNTDTNPLPGAGPAGDAGGRHEAPSDQVPTDQARPAVEDAGRYEPGDGLGGRHEAGAASPTADDPPPTAYDDAGASGPDGTAPAWSDPVALGVGESGRHGVPADAPTPPAGIEAVPGSPGSVGVGASELAEASTPPSGMAAVPGSPGAEGIAAADRAAALTPPGGFPQVADVDPAAPTPPQGFPVVETAAPVDPELAGLGSGGAGAGVEPAAVPVGASERRDGPYEGSVLSLADASGASDPEYRIKANSGSRRFYRPESPYYVRTRADVWFRTADDAQRAGFTG